MSEQALEAEAIELPADDPGADGEPTARPLPATVEKDDAAVALWGGDVRSAALAAAGGVLAGAATVAVVRATKSVASPKKRGRRMLRGKDRPQHVVASRSFLVDVHLLGQK